MPIPRDEIRKGIRENVQFGARVIKIVVDDQPYVYSEENIRFIIDEATQSGLRVAAHVWTRRGAHNAVAAGVASLEHLNGIADEDLELAKRKVSSRSSRRFQRRRCDRCARPTWRNRNTSGKSTGCAAAIASACPSRQTRSAHMWRGGPMTLR